MTLVSKLTIPALIGGIIALAATGLFTPQVHASGGMKEVVAQITGVPAHYVLNVLSAPESGADRVGTIARNAFVWVESCTNDGGWCLVDRSGTRGWVSADYLTPHDF
ncbi:SH3 domain-containing protein [Pelagibacterium limicola]|uniref:SH3 domain-containing protein n=1 Tax=Pelagibacterium limicola TaxID=2791022 RepID=UPI0018AFFD5A|nr:SH3 domain-containing protein [Pelagibacterium limicola]